MNITFLIALSLTIASIDCFYIYVDAEPTCLDFYSNIYQQRIAYDVTGDHPQNVNITVYNSQNRLIKMFNTARDTANIQTTSRFKVCFNTMDNTQKPISFDIWEDSADKIKKLASKNDLYSLHSSIAQASNILRTVSEQQKFQEQKQSIHTQMIQETENDLKTYGLLKVVIVIIVVITQILVIKSTLKSKCVN